MSRVRDVPVTAAQRAMWTLQRLHPGLDIFSGGIAASVGGPLEPELLERSVQGLVARHEILRTTFPATGAQPVQRIHRELAVPVTRHRLDDCDDEQLLERLVADSRSAYDLQRGPLVRFRVYERPTHDPVVFVGIHHLVGDLVSLRLMLEELEARHEALRTGRPHGLGAPPPQFREHSSWQNRLVESAEGRRHERYWLERLADAPSLSMPLDRSRPPREDHRGASRMVELSATLVDRIARAAKSADTSLFPMLITAFAVLLHRFSGQPSIIVGSYTTGRPEGRKIMLGPAANPIALRMDLASPFPLADAAREMSREIRRASEHQFYPLALTAERLGIRRDPSRSPVYQAAFNPDRQKPLLLSAPSWRSEPWLPLTLRGQEGQFELKLNTCLRSDGSLAAAFQYQTALYDEATAARLVRAWRVLLEDAAARPDRSLGALRLLDAESERQILRDWNRTEMEYPREAGVHELVRVQADRTPDAVAIRCRGESLTYSELASKIAGLAGRLRAEGVGDGGMVGVCMEPSIDQVAVLLAILETGAAYLPLDPTDPEARRQAMLEDCPVDLLVGTASALPGSPAPRTLAVEEIERVPPAAPRAIGKLEGGGARRAYVIFTSGSTGRPKGVAVNHCSLVNLLRAMQRLLDVGPDDSWLSITRLSFDIAALELFLPLVRGATLVVAEADVAGSGARLASAIRRYESTVLQATPGSWRLLYGAGGTGGRTITRLCGGEALSRSLADEMLGEPGPVWNVYGPTETTIWSTASRVTPGHRTPPIGRPIGNTRAYVLDAHRRPVPVGVVGELWIGGDGVADGYVGRPDLTAERFHPDPFSDDPDGRLYRTGDLARWLPSGELEYQGRMDEQVKVRGVRVELGEVEAALRKVPDIRDAVVVADDRDGPETRLFGYVVGRPGGQLEMSEVREQLRKRLPDYMMPASVTELEEIPLTANRKVDRGALPAPRRGSSEREEAFTAPRDATEEELARLFAEVLGVERVGIDDDFFALGGASIASLELAEKARRLGLSFTPEAVFEHRTVRVLATRLGEERPRGAGGRQSGCRA